MATVKKQMRQKRALERRMEDVKYWENDARAKRARAANAKNAEDKEVWTKMAEGADLSAKKAEQECATLRSRLGIFA